MKIFKPGSRISLWILISLISCNQEKETPYIDNGESCKIPIHECLDSLLNIRTNEHGGNLKLIIHIDTVKYNEKGSGKITGSDSISHYKKIVIPINKYIEFTLNKESDLLEFGEKFGLRFFHAQSFEYGNLKHLLRYDFFIHESGCWRRYKLNFGYTEIKDNENETDLGFSFGGEEDENDN